MCGILKKNEIKSRMAAYQGLGRVRKEEISSKRTKLYLYKTSVYRSYLQA